MDEGDDVADGSGGRRGRAQEENGDNSSGRNDKKRASAMAVASDIIIVSPNSTTKRKRKGVALANIISHIPIVMCKEVSCTSYSTVASSTLDALAIPEHVYAQAIKHHTEAAPNTARTNMSTSTTCDHNMHGDDVLSE